MELYMAESLKIHKYITLRRRVLQNTLKVAANVVPSIKNDANGKVK
jgi:hypothetical protein